MCKDILINKLLIVLQFHLMLFNDWLALNGKPNLNELKSTK